ncbi:MAG: TonB-dependent receptor, partial [Pseudomonadota bacterium]
FQADAIFNDRDVEDRVGLKAFVFERNFDGFLDNVTTGEDDGGSDYLNYGVTLAADISDNIDVLITAERQEFTGDPFQVPFSQPGLDLICGIPGAVPSFAPESECGLTVDDFADTFESFSDFEDDFFLDENDLTAEVNWDIGDFTLTSITAWRESDDNQTQDFDATSFPFFFTDRTQQYRQFSQELRFAGTLGSRIDFVTGFYLFDSNYALQQETDGAIFPADPVSGLLGTQILADVEQDTFSWALFADVDVNITDKLRLNLGGRFTRDQKDFRISNDLNFPTIGVVPIFDTLDPAQLPAGLETNSDGFIESEFDDFAPRVSLDYQFTDDILGFASWTQGFRAGGFNGRAGSITAATTIFEPEEVNSFEVGFKSEFLNNRIQLNTTGFVALYEDRQEDTVIPVDEPPFQETVVFNASDSTFWGIEFDSRAVITDNFDIVTSFGYLNAEFDEFPVLGVDPLTGGPATFDQSDLDIRRTPDFTFSITGNYSQQIGPGDFNGSLSFRFTDELQTTIVNANPLIGPQIDPLVIPDTNGPAFNDPRGLSETEEILNLTLSYSWDVGPTRVTGAFFARNLLDDVGLNSVLPVAGLFTFGTLDAPREIGGSISVEF